MRRWIRITDDAVARKVAEEMYVRAFDLFVIKYKEYTELFEKAVKGRKIRPEDWLQIGAEFSFIGNDIWQMVSRVARELKRDISEICETGEGEKG